MEPPKPKSALGFILKALIPYSRENLMLSYKPNQFFIELEKISNYKRRTLEEAVRRAEARGLIEKTKNQQLKLTELGKRTALPYVTKKLPGKSRLMIIFDVSEDRADDRMRLRRLLKKWGFEQAQKSVWITSYDFVEPVKEAVGELGLEGSVELYECAILYPKD